MIIESRPAAKLRPAQPCTITGPETTFPWHVTEYRDFTAEILPNPLKNPRMGKKKSERRIFKRPRKPSTMKLFETPTPTYFKLQLLSYFQLLLRQKYLQGRYIITRDSISMGLGIILQTTELGLLRLQAWIIARRFRGYSSGCGELSGYG